MATYVRQHGGTSGNDGGTAGTTLSAALSANVSSGNVLLVYVVTNNLGTTLPTVTSISKASGEANSWSKQESWDSGDATNNAGTRGELWTIQTSQQWNSGETITVTFSDSVGGKVFTIHEVSGASPTADAGSGYSHALGSAGDASAQYAMTVGKRDFAFGYYAFSNSTLGTADNDTTNGAWSAVGTNRTATGSPVSSRWQYKIPTASGTQTYNPTGFTSERYTIGILTLPNTAPFSGSVDDGLRRNLVANPSAEVDTTGWSDFGLAVGRTTATSWVGAACFTMTPLSGTGYLYANSAEMPVTGGTQYTASGYLQPIGTPAAGGFFVLFKIEWRDSSHAFISLTSGSVPSIPAGSWTRYSYTVTAPANAAYAVLKPHHYYDPAGGYDNAGMYVDGLMLEAASSAGTYFDGATTDTSTYVYEWDGTAHASASYGQTISFRWDGTATGVAPIPAANGTASGSYDFSGTSSGASVHQGTASGGFNLAGSSSGARQSNGTTSGSFDFTGTSAGSRQANGTAASGTFDFTGSAAGETPPNVGTSSGAYDFTGSSSGSRASRGAGAGAYDETGSSVGAMPAWKPKNLVATPVSGSQIDLTWDALDYSTGYDIERDGVIVATDVATNSYSDTGLDPETLYTYRVRAVQA